MPAGVQRERERDCVFVAKLNEGNQCNLSCSQFCVCMCVKIRENCVVALKMACYKDCFGFQQPVQIVSVDSESGVSDAR